MMVMMVDLRDRFGSKTKVASLNLSKEKHCKDFTL